MMKIYVGHSSSFDFQNALYAPLKKSDLAKNHHFIFPHDVALEPQSTRETICNCDLFMAEVSHPSTGLGIEIGWANVARRNILCIYKTGSRPSAALKIITQQFLEYKNSADLIEQLKNHALLSVPVETKSPGAIFNE